MVTYFVDFIGQSSLFQYISMGKRFAYNFKGFLQQDPFQYAK